MLIFRLTLSWFALSLTGCAAEPEPAAEPSDRSSNLASEDSQEDADVTDSPGGGLSFEWSANGFEQLPADFAWMGGGGDDPGVTLAIPETDNFVWISDCNAGRVRTYLALQPEGLASGDRTVLKFETESGGATREYPVGIETLPYGDGGPDSVSPVFTLPTSDPMFADLKSGGWAYFQIGEGDDAAKLRVSLVGAKAAWDAFLPACTAQG